jgi:hypothetical protein
MQRAIRRARQPPPPLCQELLTQDSDNKYAQIQVNNEQETCRYNDGII